MYNIHWQKGFYRILAENQYVKNKSAYEETQKNVRKNVLSYFVHVYRSFGSDRGPFDMPVLSVAENGNAGHGRCDHFLRDLRR